MDMSKQKMKMTPVDFDNVDCRGYLVKLDSNSKSWKKRYCILSDAFLYLYVDKETDSALGNTKGCYYSTNAHKKLTPGLPWRSKVKL